MTSTSVILQAKQSNQSSNNYGIPLIDKNQHLVFEDKKGQKGKWIH